MSFFILENKVREIKGQDIHFRCTEKPWRQIVSFDKNIENDDIAEKLFNSIRDEFKYVESALVCVTELMFEKRAMILFTESKYHLLPYSQNDMDHLTKYGDWVKFMGKSKIKI